MIRSRVTLLLRSAIISATISMCFGQVVQGQQIPLATERIEDFSPFAGRWQADVGFRQAEGPKPRFVGVLEIATSPTEIRINRGYEPIEIYRLDGTPQTSETVGQGQQSSRRTGSSSRLDAPADRQ